MTDLALFNSLGDWEDYRMFIKRKDAEVDIQCVQVVSFVVNKPPITDEPLSQGYTTALRGGPYA
jgi:hypothetical protein